MAEYKDVEQVKRSLRMICNDCWNRNSPSKCPDDCGVIETIKLLDSVPPVDAVKREIEQANKQAAYVRGYEDGQKDKYGRWGDAVPVVRCRDCKFYHRMTAETGICKLACRHLGNDGFCSEGERKDGDND